MRATLDAMRDLVQADPGKRGLASIPGDNLLTATRDDFAAACASLARPGAAVGVVTGFFIPQGTPPAGETDGPPGALFLARALTPLGIRVVLASDPFCLSALEAGLDACRLSDRVDLVEVPRASEAMSAAEYRAIFAERTGALTHLIALERVGPTHVPATLPADRAGDFRALVHPQHRGRCHTMRGRDITALMRPAHLLFEAARAARPETISIGDGGNEIGMGKLSWDVIRRNIPGGDLVACRTPADHLVVCGVSNWGAYALAAGVLHQRGVKPPREMFDPERERDLLRVMVEAGPLVDGILGRPAVSVDGLEWATHAEVLRRLGEMVAGSSV